MTAVFADGAVVVVRHGKTTRHQLTTALRALDAVGATILGTVLNMAPNKGVDSYASKSGGYYFKEDTSGRATLEAPIETTPASRNQAKSEPAEPADPAGAERASYASRTTVDAQAAASSAPGPLVTSGQSGQAVNGSAKSSSKRFGLRRPGS